MLENEKNLKDSKDAPTPYEAEGFRSGSLAVSYTKSNKLITALFMVTDIMDKSEPLRRKLRTLGAEIVSDMHTDPMKALPKISEVLSFLEVAREVNLVSQMNAKILSGEFLKLMNSVQEYGKVKSVWMEEFLGETEDANAVDDKQKYSELITRRHSPTHIGVQKGNTLLKAIKDMSNKVPAPYEARGFRSGSDIKNPNSGSTAPDFDVLKKHRRADIISVLNMSTEGQTITDIKNKSKGHEAKFSALASCGEKTLQRELVAMVRDGVLKKEGEKRWSRYSIL